MKTFNPTMVWFYQDNSRRDRYKRSWSFNPTMVWFYPETITSLIEIIVFLSIPLWSDFIIDQKDLVHRYPFYFQSHYGLILSVKQAEVTSITLLTSAFQSHYGLILSDKYKYPYKSLYQLSIPLWSDFIQWRGWNPIRTFNAFNPTMVWFYLLPVQLSNLITFHSFNPTMVWFYQTQGVPR